MATPRRLTKSALHGARRQGLSCGARTSGNILLKGENASVLAAMQQAYQGAVRCVYLDPPYNNQESWHHYDDDLDHEEWLDGMALRLGLLMPMLTADGSLWISIDDREVHYLKIVCDNIFGRERFITSVVWEHRKSRENRRTFSQNHEYILVYAKDPLEFKRSRNLLPYPPEIKSRFKNPDGDPRGPWQSVSLNVQDGHATPQQFYTIVAPNGKRHRPPNGRCWVYAESKMLEEIAKNNVWFGSDGNGVPRRKVFLNESRRGLTPPTLWTADEVGTTNSAKKHVLALFPDEKPFDTPKPESLLRRVLEIATDPGDFVLDAYLGSGTTAAVAMKMRRRFIGIEQGEHAITHCARRLRAVVGGESGGISEEVAWRGGSGFDFVDFGRLPEAMRRPSPGSGTAGRARAPRMPVLASPR